MQHQRNGATRSPGLAGEQVAGGRTSGQENHIDQKGLEFLKDLRWVFWECVCLELCCNPVSPCGVMDVAPVDGAARCSIFP